MKLFKEMDRKHDGPAQLSESAWSFIDRSAWPEARKVRQSLQQWFEKYPVKHKRELKKRLSGEFHAAFFELFLHEYFREAGCAINVHPKLADTSKCSDFLVSFPTGDKALVEAVLATDISGVEHRSNTIKSILYDEINKFNSDEFFICILKLEISDKKYPSIRKIIAFLKRELSQVNVEDILDNFYRNGESALPKPAFEDDSISLKILLLPKHPDSRGKPGRLIGMYGSSIRYGGLGPIIRSSLERKVPKVIPQYPYVIAVNVLTWGADQTDTVEALFGSDSRIPQKHGDKLQLQLNKDGFWYGPGGPKNSRVSGVIISRISQWTASVEKMRFYHNPWARQTCKGFPWGIPETRVSVK